MSIKASAQFNYSTNYLSIGWPVYKSGFDISIGGMNGLLMQKGKRYFNINLDGKNPRLSSHGNIVFYDTSFGYNDLVIKRSYVQSDARAKKNIKTLNLPSDMLDYMHPIISRQKSQKSGSRSTSKTSTYTETSIDAEALAQLFPSLVEEDDEGNYSINYMSLTPILIGILKDLKDKADQQDEIISTLENIVRINKYQSNQ